MRTVEEQIREYLRVRRAMGFRLVEQEQMLLNFAAYLRSTGAAGLSSKAAFDWAVATGGGPRWHGARLSAVRQFARWASAFDPSVEVPRVGLLPKSPVRAVPYIYSDDQIRALMKQASGLHLAQVAATYQMLIGLLACTGMRVGEALRADTANLVDGVLTLIDTKFGKSRLVPLHESVVEALNTYRAGLDREPAQLQTPALLVSSEGTRLVYANVQRTFNRLARAAGITARSSNCRPRLHDLRHTFAVNTMADAYREGKDPAQILTMLSTYLGHVSPKSTYWYLQATPELLGPAGELIDNRQPNPDGERR